MDTAAAQPTNLKTDPGTASTASSKKGLRGQAESTNKGRYVDGGAISATPGHAQDVSLAAPTDPQSTLLHQDDSDAKHESILNNFLNRPKAKPEDNGRSKGSSSSSTSGGTNSGSKISNNGSNNNITGAGLGAANGGGGVDDIVVENSEVSPVSLSMPAPAPPPGSSTVPVSPTAPKAISTGGAGTGKGAGTKPAKGYSKQELQSRLQWLDKRAAARGVRPR